MGIATRFGTPVRIVGRCADLKGVHIIDIEEQEREFCTFAYELRAPGGIPEIETALDQAPVLDCKHDA